eukprot:1151901-Pelagomonas_calceolata.AAC.7
MSTFSYSATTFTPGNAHILTSLMPLWSLSFWLYSDHIYTQCTCLEEICSTGVSRKWEGPHGLAAPGALIHTDFLSHCRKMAAAFSMLWEYELPPFGSDASASSHLRGAAARSIELTSNKGQKARPHADRQEPIQARMLVHAPAGKRITMSVIYKDSFAKEHS